MKYLSATPCFQVDVHCTPHLLGTLHVKSKNICRKAIMPRESFLQANLYTLSCRTSWVRNLMFLSRTGSFLIFGGWLIFIFDHFTHSGHEFDSCLIVSTFTKSVVTIHKPGLEYKANLLEFVRKFWLKRTMKPLVTNKFEKKDISKFKTIFYCNLRLISCGMWIWFTS